MYEFSGESQAPREPTQINAATQQTLNDLSGGEKVDPSILGITPERAGNIHREFERRVRAETDIGRVVDGVLPPEALFNPDMPLRSIDTSAGPAEIKSRGILYRTAINTLLRFVAGSETGAFFNSHNRRITVFPKLDAFSTVVAVAKGNFQSVVGPVLAHEAVHAHQSSEQKLELSTMLESIREAKLAHQEDPEVSVGEAAQLLVKSRDVSILHETQAHILQYSITGGEGQPDAISNLKSNLAKARKGEIKIEEINSEEMETAALAMEQMQFNGIPLSRYSENGYASILDLVVGRVRNYLPRKDQGNEDYLNRIQSATLQVIRLLDKGVSHRDIADLIRNNHESIHAGKERDEKSHGYKFLQQAIEQHPNQEQIDDSSLLKRFNKRMEKRVMKIRAIATEVLTTR